MNHEWQDARIIIRSVVSNENERKGMNVSIKTIVRNVRIKADIEVIIQPKNKTVVEVIHEYSKEADVVFLGLKDFEPGTEKEYEDQLVLLNSCLQTTVFVRNAGEFAGKLI